MRQPIGKKKVERLKRQFPHLKIVAAAVRGGTDHRIDLFVENGEQYSLFRDGTLSKDPFVSPQMRKILGSKFLWGVVSRIGWKLECRRFNRELELQKRQKHKAVKKIEGMSLREALESQVPRGTS